MVTGWPTPYIPYLDPGVEVDPLSANREGLQADIKEGIDLYQSEIGLMTRIKEQAKDDPGIQALCSSIISDEILTIRLSWEEINELCE